MKKKNMVLLAALALLVGLVAYGTVAYFSGEAHVTNVITTGTVDIAVVEDWDPQDGKGVMPGQSVKKVVQVENTGTGDAWVRVQVENTVTTAPGEVITDVNALLSFDINETDWVQGADGYYYYKQPLASGAKTNPLFTQVTLSTEMGNDYQGREISVDVSAQAVQSKNNSIPEGKTVVDIPGWPE